MNFGHFGFSELLMVLVIYALPLIVVIWLVRIVSRVTAAIEEIARAVDRISQRQ